MSTAKAPPRTAAEINARLQEIGVALGAGAGLPVPGWRELAKEQERLQAQYRIQLNAEGAQRATP